MKIFLQLVACFITTIASAQNFLDYSVWQPGQGTQGLFTKYGEDDENIRELGTNPYGDEAVLWRAQSNGDAKKQDGGIYTYLFPIDHQKNYRFSVWIKKQVSTSGNSYLGLHTYDNTSTRLTLTLDGTLNTNPYFWLGDLPELNKWYLVVGYMYASDYTGTVINSAVYDGTTGAKVANGRADYKFSPNATRMRLRTLLYNATDTSAFQHYYAPSVYEVNDQMPTIQEILNPSTNPPGGGEMVWQQNGPDAYFSAGKVGINTSTPDDALTVKGRIHAEEVKIDLAVPAPDYVFKKEYTLKSLEEVQNYIQKHGHLPNIPSAKEMETNGIELGIMEMKLLEKIEELTLYLIDLKKENEEIKLQLQELHKEK